jgi:hypothetical protein
MTSGRCFVGFRPLELDDAALKLDATKITDANIRATERMIWSVAARAELFCLRFVLFLQGVA